MIKIRVLRNPFTLFKYLLLLSLLGSTEVVQAQVTISCVGTSNLKIISINEKKQNNGAIEVKLIYRGIEKSSFLSYPYISKILNEKGETLAKGSLSFYGHSVNSTQTYDLKKTSIPFVKNNKVKIVLQYFYNGIPCSNVIRYKVM